MMEYLTSYSNFTKELLTCTKNIKNPSLTIYLKEDIKIDNIQKIKEISNSIIITKIKNIIKSTSIYFDPNPTNSLILKHKAILSDFNGFKEKLTQSDPNFSNNECNLQNIVKESPFVLDLEFSKKKICLRIIYSFFDCCFGCSGGIFYILSYIFTIFVIDGNIQLWQSDFT